MQHFPKDNFFTSLFIYDLFFFFLSILDRLDLLKRLFYVLTSGSAHIPFVDDLSSDNYTQDGRLLNLYYSQSSRSDSLLFCMSPVYIFRTFSLIHKHTQEIAVTLFSKALVTYKVGAKEVALHVPWFFKNVFFWNFFYKSYYFLTVMQI